jgi:hypothetical protein
MRHFRAAFRVGLGYTLAGSFRSGSFLLCNRPVHPITVPSASFARARTKNPKGTATKRYPRSFWWYLKMLFIGLQMIVFCLIVVTGRGRQRAFTTGCRKLCPMCTFIEQRNKAEATRCGARRYQWQTRFAG